MEQGTAHQGAGAVYNGDERNYKAYNTPEANPDTDNARTKLRLEREAAQTSLNRRIPTEYDLRLRIRRNQEAQQRLQEEIDKLEQAIVFLQTPGVPEFLEGRAALRDLGYNSL